MEKTYYQAPTAAVLGDVELGDGVSVWFSSVVRGDENRIKIGNQTNIQENCTVHVEEGHPVLVGERVTVGHNTILHGCTIGDETMIGMGSIIMNGSRDRHTLFHRGGKPCDGRNRDPGRKPCVRTSRKGGPSGNRSRNPPYQGKQPVLCGNCTKSSHREKIIISIDIS